MKGIVTPLKVGLFVIVAVAAFVYYVAAVRRVGFDPDESYVVYADFTDARGLQSRGRVQVAGVPVGQIESIMLVENMARVTMRVTNDVALYADATVSKRYESILGDSVIELVQGSTKARRLRDGDRIVDVESLGGVDAILQQMEFTAKNVREMTDGLNRILGQGEGSILDLLEKVDRIVDRSDRIMERVEGVTDVTGVAVQNMVKQLEVMTMELTTLVQEETDPIRNVLAATETLATEMHGLVADVRLAVTSGSGDLHDTSLAARETLARIDGNLERLQTIVQTVESGQGTLGKLVKDDQLMLDIEKSVADVSNLLGQYGKIETRVDLRTEMQAFETGTSAWKNVVGLEIAPREDKYYLFELVTDPRGSVRKYEETVNDGGSVTSRTVSRIESSFKLSAMFAKRWDWLTLRVGLIENSGGVGADVALFDGKFRLRNDFFDFTSPGYLRMRHMATWTFFDHVYVGAGIDDWANTPIRTPYGRAFTLTSGLRFTDDDLKTILQVVPVP